VTPVDAGATALRSNRLWRTPCPAMVVAFS
jgi:hypothetical protein